MSPTPQANPPAGAPLDPVSRLPRVLVVDDDEHLLSGLARQLRSEFEVSTASDGAAGLEFLQDSPGFAVLVTDMSMPGMDGLEFAALAQDLAPTTVRIMLSGILGQRQAGQAQREGAMFAVLRKPCAGWLLRETIHAAVEQHELLERDRQLRGETLPGLLRLVVEARRATDPVRLQTALRVHDLVCALHTALAVRDGWRIELAVLLDPLLAAGAAEPDGDSVRALAELPLLSEVAALVADRRLPPSPSRVPPGPQDAGAVLDAAREYEALLAAGTAPRAALAAVATAEGRDPALAAALRDLLAKGTLAA